MARESTAAGRVKIMQRWNQRGKPLLWIVLPERAVEHMRWLPGMFLTYYPTINRELVLVREDQVLMHVSPDYDLDAMKESVREQKGPRPGSVAAREVEVTEYLESLERRMERATGIGGAGQPKRKDLKMRADDFGTPEGERRLHELMTSSGEFADDAEDEGQGAKTKRSRSFFLPDSGDDPTSRSTAPRRREPQKKQKSKSGSGSRSRR